MAIRTLSAAHPLHQPRRLDLRAVFAIVLLLVATGGSISFWISISDTHAVLMATRDLPAGAMINATDLAVAHLRADDAILQASVPAGDLTKLVGQQLTEPVHADQILPRAVISSRPALQPNQVALTIAVSPETAVGGQVQPGDAVEVLLTTDKGKPDTQTTVVLRRGMVYDVGHDKSLSAVNTDSAGGSTVQGPAKWLTLVVTQDQALQLARAKWAGDLDVALLPPLLPNRGEHP